mmetsp:Transcript_22313/g.75444  ORF Transcript_22313/g.75444 Transcript_22313/m.75444 type:complete len:236 (-) Transcript_22313:163-870(-)
MPPMTNKRASVCDAAPDAALPLRWRPSGSFSAAAAADASSSPSSSTALRGQLRICCDVTQLAALESGGAWRKRAQSRSSAPTTFAAPSAPVELACSMASLKASRASGLSLALPKTMSKFTPRSSSCLTALDRDMECELEKSAHKMSSVPTMLLPLSAARHLADARMIKALSEYAPTAASSGTSSGAATSFFEARYSTPRPSSAARARARSRSPGSTARWLRSTAMPRARSRTLPA